MTKIIESLMAIRIGSTSVGAIEASDMIVSASNANNSNGWIIPVIILGVAILAIMIPFWVTRVQFSRKFDRIEKGMSFDMVYHLLGESDSRSSADGIETYIWRRFRAMYIRGFMSNTNTYIVTFKDGIVVSSQRGD